MASKKSASWDVAATGCRYYLVLPLGIVLITTILFITGGLITGLILLLHQWAIGLQTPISALFTVGLFFALFAIMLPTTAPISYQTAQFQKRYRQACTRLKHIHDEQDRVERLMIGTTTHPVEDDNVYENEARTEQQ